MIFKNLLIALLLINISLIKCDEQNLQLMKTKNPDFTLTHEFLTEMKRLFNTEILVETGSNHGSTIALGRLIFKKVYSIEMMNELYRNLVPQFKNNDNVELFEGKSEEILLKILPSIKERIIFWLDAHYCGSNTGMSDFIKTKSQTPILEELDAIHKSNVIDPIILIDDVRLFSDPYWPSLNEVYNKLMQLFPENHFIIFGDVAISYPKKENIKISKLIEALTVSKMFDSQTKKNISINSVIDAENTISKIDGYEYESLINLCNLFPECGRDSHLNLWLGLIHYNKGNFKEAYECFKKSENYSIGVKNWRLYYYMAKTAKKLNDNNLYESLIKKTFKKTHNQGETKLLLRNLDEINYESN